MKIFVDSKNLISDLKFLTGISEFQYPQFVLESNKSGVKTWLPGAKQYPRPAHLILNPATHKIGWTGRVYADSGIYETTQYKYPYRQKIIGIDLDEVPIKLFPSLVSLHLPCSIRISKSGVKEVDGVRCVGLHLLFRTSNITNFFDTEQVSNSSIKITLAPFKQQIVNLGIPVCQANFRPFWLWTNGQNRWYLKTDAEIDLVRSSDSSVFECQTIGTGRQIDTSEYSERGRLLIKLLQNAKVLPEGPFQYQRTQIWVKQVWEALKGTQFEFQTCSPMQSTSWHSNGFLDISNLTIDLFTNADNKIVLRVPTKI